jgi:hypothetical protein
VTRLPISYARPQNNNRHRPARLYLATEIAPHRRRRHRLTFRRVLIGVAEFLWPAVGLLSLLFAVLGLLALIYAADAALRAWLP